MQVQTMKHDQYVMTFAVLRMAVATVHCIVSVGTSFDQTLLWIASLSDDA